MKRTLKQFELCLFLKIALIYCFKIYAPPLSLFIFLLRKTAGICAFYIRCVFLRLKECYLLLICRYAFVEFKTALEAKTAANEVNGKILDGKPIKATVCSERPPGNDNWKPLEERTLEDFDLSSLFISNLPRFAERTDLAQIFRTADKINFMNMPDGTCKG